MIVARRYSPTDKSVWDRFVIESREGTFLFQRDFMDYHQDRFTDASLICFSGKRCVGILPASAHKEARSIKSHGGLTYGTLLTLPDASAELVRQMWVAIATTYRSEGFERIEIKPTPHIYHRIPAEETLYWLFRASATLSARTLSATIDLQQAVSFTTLRRRMRNKALRNNLSLQHGNHEGWQMFWPILEEALLRHNTSPVHRIAEMEQLATLFPKNISLHTVHKEGNCIGGCVLFHTPQTIHVQYIATNSCGRQYGALDLLFAHLIEQFSAQYHASSQTCPRYFDFGISTERGGQVLNHGLMHQKEGFGGRAICYDTYLVELSQLEVLSL